MNDNMIEITLPQDIVDYIEECKEKPYPDSYLIAILHRIQKEFGYLSEENMDQVAQLLQVPTSTVSGVATFYHFFRLQPKGTFHISVCMGTACFVKGGEQVLDSFKYELGVEMGETTSDQLFTLESSRCIGVCSLAPVVTINGKVYSKVTPNQVPDILNRLKENEK